MLQRLVVSFTLALVVSIAATSATAQADTIQSGAQYLLQQQGPGGAFGVTTGEEPVGATAEAVQALKAIGQMPAASSGGLYLSALPQALDSELELRRRIALRGTAWALPSVFLSAHGPGFEEPDVLHLALSLLDDPSSNGSFGAASPWSSRLVRLAQPGGCFGPVDNPASVEVTALAIAALRSIPPGLGGASASAAIDAALACLKLQQQGNGSFGTLVATAAAVHALTRTAGAQAALTSARSHLAAAQESDGSWGHSVRITAKVLQALGSAGPDWKVATDELGRPILRLSTTEPLKGSTFQATLDVSNIASSPAPPTVVRFTAVPQGNGAVITLAEVSLAALASGGTSRLVAQLPTTALSGSYEIRAVVDPDQLHTQLDRTNDVASAIVKVRVEQDLSVAVGSLKFAPAGQDRIAVNLTVLNAGTTLSKDVVVDLYRGTPGTNGVKIGTGVLHAGMASNATALISAEWHTTSANGPTPFYGVVDPDNVLSEANEENNKTFTYYHPPSGKPVDLVVVAESVTQSPNPAQNDKPFTFSVTVQNLSENDANQVEVQVRRPSQRNATVAATEIPSIPAGTSLTVQLRLALEGSDTLQIVVDPLELLNDTARHNNSTIAVAYVLPKDPLNLKMVEVGGQIRYAEPGSLNSVQVTVTNGSSKSQSTTLRIANGRGGATLAATPFTLGPDETRTISLSLTAPEQPATLKACIDPFNALEEDNENDNCGELSLGSTTGDVFVRSRDMHFVPVGPEVGEKTQAFATITNNGAQRAEGQVAWWQGSPRKPEAIYLGSSSFSVEANSTVESNFEFVRKDGPIEVFAELTDVSPFNAPSGGEAATAGRHLFLKTLIDSPNEPQFSRGYFTRVANLTGGPRPNVIVGYYNILPGGLTAESVVTVYETSATGSISPLWSHPIETVPLNAIAADVDADGQPELFTVSQTLTNGEIDQTVWVDLLAGDGTLLWRQSVRADYNCARGLLAGSASRESQGLGDLNGDGVADLVVVSNDLTAMSGIDGSILWKTPLNPINCGAPVGRVGAVVLDVEGDGKLEVLGHTGGAYFLADHQGHLRWYHNGAYAGAEFAVADVDSDGYPDLVTAPHMDALQYRSILTGELIQSAPFFSTWETAFSAGMLRQDGLPYFPVSKNGFDMSVAAFAPDASILWERQYIPLGNVLQQTVLDAALADLEGRGRPQVIAKSLDRPLIILDGRNGDLLHGIPQEQPSNLGLSSFYQHGPIVIADADGDDRGDVIFNLYGSPTATDGSQPFYGRSVAAIFASRHWKRMPRQWPSMHYVKGQIGEDLKVHADYRWWTTHNTWNQQFDVEPAKLLADLAIKDGDVSRTPETGVVGQPMTLTAQVRNIGGLTASNIKVSFYDGDPADGGRLIGTTVVPGPLAVRTGIATASVTWNAYPEGQHFIYAVANDDGSASGPIEESGGENNTSSVRVFVKATDTGCDLALVASSLSAWPATPTAGEPLVLTAMVTNVGNESCTTSSLTVYDGQEGANASALGTGLISALAAGASSTVSLSVEPLPGSFLLRFVADDAAVTLDIDRTNNQASLPLDVPSNDEPDLLPVGFAASPSPAWAGEPVTLTAVVKNRGAEVGITHYLVTLNGAPVADGLVPPLNSGESTTLTASINAPASSGVLLLRLDSANAVNELDESNNAATAPLLVGAAQVRFVGSASPLVAGANTAVAFALNLSNLATTGLDLSIDAAVFGSSGSQVASLVSGGRVVLGGNGTQPVPLSWNTGASAPGAYQLRAQVKSAGRLLSSLTLPFAVVGDARASAVLVADRGSYKPGETVLLSARVTNSSANADLQGATSILTLVHPDGHIVQSTEQVIELLPPQAFSDLHTLFRNAPSEAPGRYTARLEVRSTMGSTLAVSEAGWTVEVQSAAQLTGALQLPLALPLGPPLQSQLALTNPSGAALPSTDIRLELLDAESLTVESSTSVNVTLTAGEHQNVSFTLPTAAVSPGQKLVVARTSTRTLDRALVDANAFQDNHPPVVTITGVSDGLITKLTVSPQISVQDESPVEVSLALDGTPYVSGTTISAEGDHLLVVDAHDSFGNATYREIRFTVDTTPPAVTISGVTAGDVRNTAVTLTAQVTELHPDTLTATLDGAPFALGGQVSTEGAHTLVVRAVDKAGNEGQVSVSFELDLTAPQLALSGVADGALTRSLVTLSWTASDAHLGTVTGTVDGTPIASGAVVSSEGNHMFKVVALDTAGNRSEKQLTFTIDRTAPTISIGGVAAGEVRGGSVTPSVLVSDAHPDTTQATLDNLPFALGGTVTAEGPHTLVVTATDAAGNSANATVSFEIDLTAPQVAVAGVVDGALLKGPVSPTFSASDRNLVQLTATLDGAAFSSGAPVSTEGNHLLVVTALDRAGNRGQRQVSFTLDKTPPAITIAGVSAGELRNSSFAPTIQVTDAHPGTTQTTLNGAAYTSGTAITVEGSYILAVTATDGAGNQSQKSVSFELDKTAPVVTVSGVADGAYYAAAVAAVFSATDRNLNSVSATLDGVAFASGGSVGAAGTHLLVVTATDKAGNSAQKRVTFTVDLASPTVTVSGVSEGAEAQSFTPVYSASDANLLRVSAALNGASFSSGTVVQTVGAYTLVVTAEDRAGRTASTVVHFRVIASPPAPAEPKFNYAACALGTLKLSNNARVEAASGNVGSIATHDALTLSNNAVVTGDAVTKTNGALSNNAQVLGKLYYGGTVSLQNNAKVSGGTVKRSPAPTPCETGYDLDGALNAAFQKNDNSKLTSGGLAPYFKNGGLELTNNVTATLPAGTFYLKSLKLSNNARLRVASGAKVTLFIEGSVEVTNNATLNDTASAQGTLLVVTGASSAHSQKVTLQNNAEVAFQLYAPLADVALSNNARLRGELVGRNVELSNNQVLYRVGTQAVPPPLTAP